MAKLPGLCLCAKFPFDTDEYGIYTAFMEKQEIKKRLLEAVKSDSHLDDIKSVAVFGSYVNGQAKEDSDVDVLVQFTEDAHIGFFEYVRIQRNLSQALGLKVDLVTREALSKYIKDQVLQEAEVVYER